MESIPEKTNGNVNSQSAYCGVLLLFLALNVFSIRRIQAIMATSFVIIVIGAVDFRLSINYKLNCRMSYVALEKVHNIFYFLLNHPSMRD